MSHGHAVGPPPGTRVQLHSMQTAGFNDLAGTIVGPAPSSGRYIVKLDNLITKSVNVANIRPEGGHTYLSAPHLFRTQSRDHGPKYPNKADNAMNNHLATAMRPAEAAVATAARPAAAVRQPTAALHSGSPLKSMLRILARYAANVTAHPGEKKYRKLKFSNPTFANKVWCNAVAKEMLLKSGWRSDVKEGWLVLDDSCATGAALTAAVADAAAAAAAGRGGPDDTTDGVLEVGCRVVIYGLEKRPELNGAEGVVDAEVKEKGRWRVKVPVGGGEVKSCLFKASCLALVATAADEARNPLIASNASSGAAASPLDQEAIPELRFILANVHADVLTFIRNLNGFYRNKKGIEALRARIVAPGILESIAIAAVGIQDEVSGAFNVSYYQRQKDGKTPIRNTEDLYEAAALVLPLFEQMLTEIAATIDVGVKVKLSPSGLKARDRAERKAKDDYSDRPCPAPAREGGSRSGGPAIGWVYDLVRGTFMCESAAVIKQVVERLVADSRVQVVLKFKNRFKNPTPSGFCDMMLQIVFSVGSLVHVCEVQVHLREIYEFDAAHESHKAFEYFRGFFDGNMETVEARLKDMEVIIGPAFVPADDGTPTSVVLEQLVVDVVESRDVVRMGQMIALCLKYLQIFDLARYIQNAKLLLGIEHNGECHASVIEDWFNMSRVLQQQGKLDGAMSCLQKAQAVLVKTSGGDHPTVGLIFQSMGEVLCNQGKHDEALGYYQKALPILVDSLGEEHETVAMLYHNMAGMVAKTSNWEDEHLRGGHKQGKHDNAMFYFQKVIAIKLKNPSAMPNINVGDIYNNIACLLIKQGKRDAKMDKYEEAMSRFEEAMSYQQKALPILVKEFGENHANVGSSHTTTAIVLELQGKFEEAMGCYQKSLAIMKKSFGPTHPNVAMVFNNMAVCCTTTRNYAQAFELINQATNAYRHTYGEHHPDTLRTIRTADHIRRMMR